MLLIYKIFLNFQYLYYGKLMLFMYFLKLCLYLTFYVINDKIVACGGGNSMKTIIDINKELDQVFINISKIENELDNLLFPIHKIIENHGDKFTGIMPINIASIPINKIIERLRALLTNVISFELFDNIEKNKINLIIRNCIVELQLLELDWQEETRRLTELNILMNNRKDYVLEKYNLLVDIDLKIKKISDSLEKIDALEFESLVSKKKEIISDIDVCGDLKVSYDYDNFDDNSYSKNLPKLEKKIDLNNITSVDDLYKLVNFNIDKQINSYMQYRYLSKSRIKELTEKLSLSVRKYVNEYILNNYNLSTNIEEFSYILNTLLKSELEDYFEIKNKLGVEYVTASENNELRTISVKEVVEGKYNGFEYDIINKYSTLLELSQVDEQNVDIVRKFVINMGPEFVPIFDKLWIQVNTKARIKILNQKKYNKKQNIVN